MWFLLRAPNWGPGLQPRHVPWLGIKPVTLWFAGWYSIHWVAPARAEVPSLKGKVKVIFISNENKKWLVKAILNVPVRYPIIPLLDICTKRMTENIAQNTKLLSVSARNWDSRYPILRDWLINYGIYKWWNIMKPLKIIYFNLYNIKEFIIVNKIQHITKFSKFSMLLKTMKKEIN